MSCKKCVSGCINCINLDICNQCDYNNSYFNTLSYDKKLCKQNCNSGINYIYYNKFIKFIKYKMNI